MVGDEIAEFSFPSAVCGFLVYHGVWAPLGRSRECGDWRGGAESGDSEGSEGAESSEVRRARRYSSGDVVVIL